MVQKMDPSHQSYELKLVVKSCRVCGGGLPNDSFAEILIDGSVVDVTKTATPCSDWNKVVIKRFSENESPYGVNVAVCKKRWTSHGYKKVGTVDFPLRDLMNGHSEEYEERSFKLVSPKRNVTLRGSLVLGWEMHKRDRSESLSSLQERLTDSTLSTSRDTNDTHSVTSKTSKASKTSMASKMSRFDEFDTSFYTTAGQTRKNSNVSWTSSRPPSVNVIKTPSPPLQSIVEEGSDYSGSVKVPTTRILTQHVYSMSLIEYCIVFLLIGCSWAALFGSI